jgi:hypothetical protein
MSNYFNLNLFWSAPWEDFYQFLTMGNPSLLLLLLGVNTIFLLFFVTRRARQSRRLRPATLYWVQAMMMATNLFVVFQKDVINYLMTAKGII